MLTLRLPPELLGNRSVRSSGKLLYGLMLAEGCGMTTGQAARRLGYSERGTQTALDTLLRAGLVTRTKEEMPDYHPGTWRWRYVYRAKGQDQ